MGSNSGISWTNDTWNPWQGCFKVSQGCKHCYMYRDKERYGQQPNIVVRSKPATFNAPFKLAGPLVFTCSWSDWFIDEADEWRDEAWDIIKQTPHLTYQILTKRPENITYGRVPYDGIPANVWLGVSVENQDNVWRLDFLKDFPFEGVKFVSWEPSLGYVDFTNYPWLDWVIGGGESGPDFRPANMEWFRQVIKDCQAIHIPYFHKQNGGNRKVDGVWGGDKVDEEIHQAFPIKFAVNL